MKQRTKNTRTHKHADQPQNKFHNVNQCSKNVKVLVDNVIRYNFAHSYPTMEKKVPIETV